VGKDGPGLQATGLARTAGGEKGERNHHKKNLNEHRSTSKEENDEQLLNEGTSPRGKREAYKITLEQK